MAYKALLLTLLLGGGAWGMTLQVNSGAQLTLGSFSQLNQFLALTNQLIQHVNQDPMVEGEVPPLEPLRLGVGFSVGELVGRGVALGGQATVLAWETDTQGAWNWQGDPYPVALGLRVELFTLEVQLAVEIVPGLLALGLAGGWGWASLSYQSSFSLPTDWEIPFLPPPGEAVYRASGGVGAVRARLSFPLGSGVALGLEVGARLAWFGRPTAGGTPLDLDGDGQGEGLDLTSLWLGASVNLALEL